MMKEYEELISIYIDQPSASSWEKFSRKDLRDCDPHLLKHACDKLVSLFLQDMERGCGILKESGFEFNSDRPIVSNAETLDSRYLQLPLLLQSWCERILSIRLLQKTEQMLDIHSPFRGFGMFGIGMEWDGTLIKFGDDYLSDEDPCLELRPGSLLLLDSFRVDGGKLTTNIPCKTLEVFFESGEDSPYTLTALMRREARFAGYSRLEFPAPQGVRLSPRQDAIPKEFPLEESF